MTLKPGSASRPFPGVEPVLLREDGTECGTATKAASSASASPGPGMMRTMWGDHDRFVETYFTMYNEPVLHR